MPSTAEPLRFFRGVLVMTLLLLNIVLWGSLVFAVGLLKLLARGPLRRRVVLDEMARTNERPIFVA